MQPFFVFEESLKFITHEHIFRIGCNWLCISWWSTDTHMIDSPTPRPPPSQPHPPLPHEGDTPLQPGVLRNGKYHGYEYPLLNFDWSNSKLHTDLQSIPETYYVGVCVMLNKLLMSYIHTW